MSANTNMASSHLSSSSANAQAGSILDRAAALLKGKTAEDLVVNALWVALAGYGLVATINVFLTY